LKDGSEWPVEGTGMTNVSDFVVKRIREWGVTRVFGFPGDGIGEKDSAQALVAEGVARVRGALGRSEDRDSDN
jgi:thiamine pyrophosphate-dependent acetolactate synthase large subunit-like protein